MNQVDTASDGLTLLRGPLRDFIEVPFLVTSGTSSMESIEVQRLEFPDGRRGHMVKVQHHGGVVDLYPEAHLGLTTDHIASDPAFAHLDVRRISPTDFDEIGIHVSATDARCVAAFTDADQRSIFFEVATSRRSPAKPIFIPAPPHRNPRTLRLLLVEHFWLFQQSRSSITLRADGLELAPLPFPNVPGARHWSGRAGGENHLVGLNLDRPHPDFAGAAHAFSTERSGDHYEITSPLGAVLCGTIAHADGQTMVTATPCWQPPAHRPLLMGLAVIRRLRRRNEAWTWVGDDAAGSWTN